MKLFKKTIFSIFGAALLATGFVACSSDDNSTTESTVTETTNSTMSVKEEKEDVINECLSFIGVNHVKNYRLENDKDLESFILNQKIDYKDYNMKDVKIIDFQGDYDNFGISIQNINNVNESIVLRIKKEGNKYDLLKSTKVKTKKFKSKLVIEYIDVFDSSKVRVVDSELLSVYADESELGPKRPNEDYWDCFERNWDNFGYDMIGKLTQATNPHWVAVAIAAVCAFEED